MEARKTISVVCAILLNAESKILLARRKRGLVREGFWEFPGGKIEKGELPEQAIVREIKEEFFVDVIPVRRLNSINHSYAELNIELIAILCEAQTLPVTSTDHDQLVFVDSKSIGKYQLSEADMKLWKRILKSGLF